MKPQKLKVDIVDISHFPMESLKIDPYWNDLYNPPQQQVRRRIRPMSNG